MKKDKIVKLIDRAVVLVILVLGSILIIRFAWKVVTLYPALP